MVITRIIQKKILEYYVLTVMHWHPTLEIGDVLRSIKLRNVSEKGTRASTFPLKTRFCHSSIAIMHLTCNEDQVGLTPTGGSVERWSSGLWCQSWKLKWLNTTVGSNPTLSSKFIYDLQTFNRNAQMLLRNILRIFNILFIVLNSSCYAEFDLGGRIPRRDPCTHIVDDNIVYVMPTCRNVPAQTQR